MARESRRDRLATYQDEINRAKTWRFDRGLDRKWRRMEKLYEGDFLPPSNDDQMRVNLAFSTINVILPNLTLNAPRIGVVARHRANEDRATITEEVLNYFWEHHDFGVGFKDAVKDALIFGFGWCKVGWKYIEEDVPIDPVTKQAMFEDMVAQRDDAAIRDPGQEFPSNDEIFDALPSTTTIAAEDRPFVERISPYDIYVNPEATRTADMRWVAQRILMRKEDLESDDRYSPKARKEAQGGMGETDYDDPRRLEEKRYVEDEWVVVWEFYDIARKEMAVFVDGAERFLVAPRRLPYAYGHPFEMLRNYERPGEFYPMGDLEEIEDMVHEISMTRSQMLSWRKRHVPKMLYRDGALDRNDLPKLTNTQPGTLVPVKDDNIDMAEVLFPVPQTPLERELFDWSAQIQSDVNEISGVSEFARGTGTAGSSTATEATLIQDAQNARSQEKLQKVEFFISNLAQKLQMVTAQFLTGEHFVRVAGQDNAALFVPYDRDTVMGEFDFKVEAGSTEPQNETFRRQQAIALMQTMMPFIEAGVVDLVRLGEHVLRDGFNVHDAASFLTPQALAYLDQADQQISGVPGGAAAPGNGVGVDAPQPSSADRADLNAEAESQASNGVS